MLTKKNLLIVGTSIVGSSFLLISAPANALSLVSRVGDEDCFGISRSPCIIYPSDQITSAGDPHGFDVWNPVTFGWTHTYSAINGSITNAQLIVSTLDVEDNGAGDGLGGEPYDITLSIDGIEILGAFDDVFSPDGDGSNTPITGNTVTFDLDLSFFNLLADGQANLFINSHAGRRNDWIAVDYAELRIEYENIPTPVGFLPVYVLGVIAKRKKETLSNK